MMPGQYTFAQAVMNPKGINGERESHKICRDETDKFIIDSCYTCDTRRYETGIKRRGYWEIVEQYDTEEEMIIGHAKYLKELTEDPNREYVDLSD